MKKLLFLFTLSLLVFSCNQSSKNEINTNNLTLFIGTFGDTLYKYNVNMDSLTFTQLKSVQIKNPSYLTLSNNKKYIYAVSENGENSSVVAVNNNEDFSVINSEYSVGAGPCFIEYYKNSIFTANYSSGSMSCFPIDILSGKIFPTSFFADYNKYAANFKEKLMAHAHTTRVLEVEKDSAVLPFLLVTDLGTDKIMIYKVLEDTSKNILQENNPPFVSLFKKYGPRHLDIHKGHKAIYVLGEISGLITTYKYSLENDNLQLNNIQEIAADTTGANGSGDIHISPSGRYLYASNRLINDGIAIFKINDDATLTKVGYQNTGAHPRNFVISPCGKYLFVASRDANRVEVYKIDENTGLLSDIGKTLNFATQKPVCLIFEK